MYISAKSDNALIAKAKKNHALKKEKNSPVFIVDDAIVNGQKPKGIIDKAKEKIAEVKSQAAQKQAQSSAQIQDSAKNPPQIQIEPQVSKKADKKTQDELEKLKKEKEELEKKLEVQKLASQEIAKAGQQAAQENTKPAEKKTGVGGILKTAADQLTGGGNYASEGTGGGVIHALDDIKDQMIGEGEFNTKTNPTSQPTGTNS